RFKLRVAALYSIPTHCNAGSAMHMRSVSTFSLVSLRTGPLGSSNCDSLMRTQCSRLGRGPNRAFAMTAQTRFSLDVSRAIGGTRNALFEVRLRKSGRNEVLRAVHYATHAHLP